MCVCGGTVIAVGIGFGDLSSNPGRDYMRFFGNA